MIKKLLGLMTMLCLYVSNFGQKIKIEPFYIGDRIPDLPLHRIINYKDSAATLSSFGSKLIVLDFWGIHCSSCISNFLVEDSLQQVYKDRLQFVLITLDTKEKVIPFLQRFDSIHHLNFSLPIVCSDSVLCCLFRHHAIPHYVWLAPNGSFLAQTGAEYITASTIERISGQVLQLQQQMRRDNFSEVMLAFPKPSKELKEVIHQNKILIDNI